MNFLTGKHVDRRTLLRGVGAAIALPLLDAMRPALKTLLASAPEMRGRVPRGWRRMCQVDRHGQPA